jgi:vacuolar-type H+-ATPase subunit I/STV1
MSTDKSLAELIDESFSPEARKRLVQSLKKREADHVADIERLKQSLGRERDQAVGLLTMKLHRAETSHQTVIDQFMSFKKLASEDAVREWSIREAEAESKEAKLVKKYETMLHAEKEEHISAEEEMQRSVEAVSCATCASISMHF